MSAPALACTPRLALLIPMLGSDFDGEIVAAVHAIRRELASEGADLHDLVKVISCSGTSLAPASTATVDAHNWRDAAHWLRRQSGLSAWERNFLDSIREFSRLSEKQRSKLADILAKVRGRQS